MNEDPKILYIVQSACRLFNGGLFYYTYLYTLDPELAQQGLMDAIKLKAESNPDRVNEYFYRVQTETLDAFNGVGQCSEPPSRYYAPDGSLVDPGPLDSCAVQLGQVFYIDRHGKKRYWNSLMWGILPPLNIR